MRERLSEKSRRVMAPGASLTRANARVEPVMWGGADPFPALACSVRRSSSSRACRPSRAASWRGDRRERCNRGPGEAAERIIGLEVGEATPISGRPRAASRRAVAVVSAMQAARPKPLAGGVHDRPTGAESGDARNLLKAH